MPEAWDITTGCSSIKIAIIDNGVQLNHPDLAGNLVVGLDATGNGNNGDAVVGENPHGTKCAGIAAAASNAIGIAGAAYSRKIVPVRAYSTLGGNIATDVFLGYAEKRNDNTSFHWNAQGYNRINPGVSGELGLQWKRISLLAEYKSNLADTFSKGYKLSTGGEVRRSIFRQGLSIKMSFLLTPLPREN